LGTWQTQDTQLNTKWIIFTFSMSVELRFIYLGTSILILLEDFSKVLDDSRNNWIVSLDFLKNAVLTMR